MDFSLRYNKRDKATHRFAIADHGRVRELTVPVSRPEGGFEGGELRWSDILVSAHGRWWETIPTALESAYGRTPFFQYYAPKFASLFREPAPGMRLAELVTEADGTVRGILGIPPAPGILTEETVDLTSLPPDTPGPRPYWQPGPGAFVPGLSVLDLIFNMGPEAPLYLI